MGLAIVCLPGVLLLLLAIVATMGSRTRTMVGAQHPLIDGSRRG